MKTIKYKGGVTMVSRPDDPTYQCISCYKPWFQDDLSSLTVVQPTCPNCGAKVRKLTDEAPLITE